MAIRPVTFYLDYVSPSFHLRLNRTPFPRLSLPQHLHYLLYGLMLLLDQTLLLLALLFLT